MNYNSIINIVMIVLLVWFVYSRFGGVKGLKNLKPDQFQDELKENRNRILIDVREPGELKQGYIPGAINIPLSRIKQRVREIPANKNVYLYCRSGMRSKQAARILQKNGFRELSHLQGGIMSWRGKLTK
ncbi:rhodanese-like domain-containing protein [Paenibacillus chondroitinus]|uniref:Rhodanese-like domain-containing protein n=1 Tax=Paenibacillus chondroitinus TaxID=59842 RepID=A0ABU6DGY2_9BACL|nr:MULTISPECIES: rhodanese-like domain-containing protein [Paenibacillus]MCY9659629.1 rhodanese-like domain-containing protein [Paenibacillus anseongense]MEB4797025.1 rhodanese-like domain-containing protein [Paenibacillus chondroitinus]